MPDTVTGTGTRRRTVLDAGSAAPVRPEAREAWLAALDDGWADPRRLHAEGRAARLLLDAARERVAEVLAARPDDVFFPPHHAAAAHSAVMGLAAARPVGAPVVTTAVEHSAVLHAASWLERTGGRPHVEVGVDALGHLDHEQFKSALPGAAVAAVQHANGEIGTVQPLDDVASAATAAGVPLIVDAGVSLGFLPAPRAGDALVGNPRAWGSVPGVGLLVLRPGTRWRPHGPGEAEGAHRRPGEAAGEVDVPAAVAAAVSLAAAEAQRDETSRRLTELVTRVRACAGSLPDVEVAGDPEGRAPHVVTFSVLYLPGEMLVQALDAEGFAVTSGSACTADTLRPSHVLAAVGGLTHGNVRLVLPAAVRRDEVEAFCVALPRVVTRLRAELGVDEL